ncbi:MutT/nudix family protein [Candidatus Koribacter versatilis Ellin345]|uniref:MutT/nudix family protein n=1 Tax=Koribacter versatilis (strain Ellin345) TaxID=204669 RepID=Q1IIS4_KORVE|nr:DNA mismatch repair protein MutT [Candidatus Koribacter versatilis]ABF43226.1 MutT/nudix family protein [Candidatus Koribacter versatilis Ellin345]
MKIVLISALLLSSSAWSFAQNVPAPGAPDDLKFQSPKFAKGSKAAKMQKSDSTPKSHIPDAAELRQMGARFAPTELKIDPSSLSPGDQKALAKLVEAAKVINDVFLTQYWKGNHALWTKLQADTTELGRERARYFWINKSPWSALDGLTAFLPDVPAKKLPGANFYPEDMTREEFEAWVKTLPEKDQESAKGFFTVIQRGADKKLTIVPFSEAYKADLTRCASLLKEAADLTDNASLKKFLNSRADAFASNDYYQSDMDWMDLDAPIDPTIGPYETYNDEIFGYKASYEAYITVRDDAETKKLSSFSAHLQEIENNLPLDPKYRNPKLGAAAPIRVVNEVFAAGDGDHGVQTAAYNLPNDDRVVAQKGSKRVMLKNVQAAKFNSVLIPISKQVLKADAQQYVDFDLFFTHILTHELCHGLGPHEITVNGKKTNPRIEIKELYSALEEAKADVTGLFALQYMLDHAKDMGLDSTLKIDNDSEKKLYTTYLASSFRTLRFGTHEAHGKGMAVQVSYLMKRGAFVANPDGTFSVDYKKIKDAVRDLDKIMLTLEAEGDYAGTKKLLDDYGTVPAEMQKAIAKMSSVPVDIEPLYVTAKALTK